MNDLFSRYTSSFVLTGDLSNDIDTFYKMNNDLRTLNHTLEVAEEAERIANLFEIDSFKVVRAALLHDISNVIPISTMLDVAKTLSIEVLEEELKYDRSVHQKLSKYMAQEFLVSLMKRS
ncbi:HD domain-containing protein [Paenibacillus sp. GCM10023252]|uniref:HD domain-containing protein n=1 Tax=Paenibacillus sp. GCM10023252 TaxID=3252649 RepID=UPI003621189E